MDPRLVNLIMVGPEWTPCKHSCVVCSHCTSWFRIWSAPTAPNSVVQGDEIGLLVLSLLVKLQTLWLQYLLWAKDMYLTLWLLSWLALILPSSLGSDYLKLMFSEVFKLCLIIGWQMSLLKGTSLPISPIQKLDGVNHMPLLPSGILPVLDRFL